ncbi:MAG: hypothetical protein L0I94_11010 [Yaniella sp.]|uniref:hypothetical protein n=1 Tax=Yaniella sp. TaxID=2773929 RepID=UPI0026498890|nr:hypothetical protein [Yaniella sp.]MDN5890102.1 hypothetical protein [Yaniella sp.]MDN6149341.1 hypothetical protein [Yaniella sp.]MDN6151538.1 hypothetical protein [Yaniella sp.]MDN6171870.1 hypothetical protein [Yaniella sp.]MDN6358903.1 hypothetical protein [Yaniella sp.]
MHIAKPPGREAMILTLSEPRFDTYVTECDSDAERAAELYGWNAAISAAFMLPAHFAEVSIRNAVADALVSTYGPEWPWETVFEHSLPNTRWPAYNPRGDLISTRSRETTTGKVVAELKLAFWSSMFTARHDTRVWSEQLFTVLPNSDMTKMSELRGRIRQDIEEMRKLRNRIAHHEPIFTRNLHDDLHRMFDLVTLRSPETSQWVRELETVTELLHKRP